ncbi:hypothetical protein BJL96_27490 [Burkholderia cenocepacia]|nr:hypothetical protein [Burkholderia cenocepacia]
MLSSKIKPASGRSGRYGATQSLFYQVALSGVCIVIANTVLPMPVVPKTSVCPGPFAAVTAVSAIVTSEPHSQQTTESVSPSRDASAKYTVSAWLHDGQTYLYGAVNLPLFVIASSSFWLHNGAARIERANLFCIPEVDRPDFANLADKLRAIDRDATPAVFLRWLATIRAATVCINTVPSRNPFAVMKHAYHVIIENLQFSSLCYSVFMR